MVRSPIRVTYTILGGPYYNYRLMFRETLFRLLRPLYARRESAAPMERTRRKSRVMLYFMPILPHPNPAPSTLRPYTLNFKPYTKSPCMCPTQKAHLLSPLHSARKRSLGSHAFELSLSHPETLMGARRARRRFCSVVCCDFYKGVVRFA